MSDEPEQRMSNGHAMAYALQEAAHRLFTYDPTAYACCGTPLTEFGRCDHRDYHATAFSPQVGDDGSVNFPSLDEQDLTAEVTYP